MSDLGLGKVTDHVIYSSSNIKKAFNDLASNGSSETVQTASASPPDTVNSHVTSEHLANSISRVLNDLNNVNNNTREEDVNLNFSEQENHNQSITHLFSDLNALSGDSEFNSIREQLDSLNLKLNISSPDIQDFLQHFYETQSTSSKPDLMGIFDHISSLEDIVTRNFSLNDAHLIALSRSKEDNSESVALLNKDTSQLEFDYDTSSFQNLFSQFESKTFYVSGKQLLIGLNGLKPNSTESPKKFDGAYLMDLDSGEIVTNYTHPDFASAKTFKGAKMQGDFVSINSNGSEYVFKKDGEFQNKLTAPGNNNKISNSEIIGNNLYALAASSQTEDGKVTGSLYKFDINTSEVLREFTSPNKDETSATFGSNMTQGEHGRLFISENPQVSSKAGVSNSGRIHSFNTNTDSFDQVIYSTESSNSLKGLGYFGSNLTVNNKYLAVSSEKSDGERIISSQIHVFDLRKNNEQTYDVKLEDFGVKLDGKIALDGDKLLASSITQGGRSQIYEFDLSTREKNLERFTQILHEDLNTLSAVKDSIVVSRLATDNEEIEGNEKTTKNQSIHETNQAKVAKFVEHLGHSFTHRSNKSELIGVQTNAVGSKVMDLLP